MKGAIPAAPPFSKLLDMTGVHMLHGGVDAAGIQLQDGPVHLPTPVRREGKNTDRRVGTFST